MATAAKKHIDHARLDESKTVSIADAKAQLSALVTHVQAKRMPVTILRRGVPIAQIVPIVQTTPALYGSMRGTVQELGDIVGPTGVEWTAGDE
jgi:prevent-host-death family protein